MDDQTISPARKKAAEAKKPEPKPWERPPGNTKEPPKGITAVELFAKDFPPPKFVLDGLIGDGLTMLCGKPKQGKSWLALEIAWAVAAGLEIDGRKTWQGEVLYLALEDTLPRLQSRMRKLHSELGWVIPETLTLHTHWPRDGDQMGLVFLGEWLLSRQGIARLVIVDTLAKFRKPTKNNANAYAEDYAATSDLKDMVDFHKSSAMYVHHTRKLRSEDPFDEISGSYGISGSADTLIVLENENGRGKLFVRGRDLPEATVPIEFRPASGRWVLGESKDGLDTEGRIVGNGEGKKSVVERCADWLRTFLATEAFPSQEITWAAEKAGFKFSAVKLAKGRLGSKGTGEITHHNFSTTGQADWWSGPATDSVYNWTRRSVPVAQPKNTESTERTPEIPT
jgi:hypothetical protein